MRKSNRFLHLSLVIFLISFGLIACSDDKPSSPNTTNNAKPVPTISYSIRATLPHDTSYFTQGLEFYDSTLIESTGLHGKSKLLQLDPATGKVFKQVDLDSKFFGEGITVLNDTIYQLTYLEHVVFVYTVKDFKKVKEFPLNGEGWGITNDGQHLIVTNGSSDLFYYEPQTFRFIKSVTVSENGSMVHNLNELEFVNGYIYANRWQYPYIYKIDPDSGEVVGKMDMTDLIRQAREKYRDAEVLNGIAFNPANKKFYVTGKNWPVMYELELGGL